MHSSEAALACPAGLRWEAEPRQLAMGLVHSRTGHKVSSGEGLLQRTKPALSFAAIGCPALNFTIV